VVLAGSRRTVLVLLVGMSLLGLSGAPFDGGTVLAQGAIFDCPAPATPAAAASSGGAAASPMAMEAAFPEAGGDLTVFAASSLTDAFEQIATDLEAAHPGLAITYNFGGSPALVTQLSEGAEADALASANNTQMQAATDNGSISGKPVTFVHNRLVIVTPADNPAGIATPADLGNEGLKIVLAQAEVPVGRYARESVCKMAQNSAEFGEDFVARVAGNVVSEEEDVRDVLAKVTIGEADAGIVYVSDAAAAGEEVQIIEIPDALNIVASYPIAVVSGGDEALADAFIAYLLSPDGQATLADFGFEPVS
jgi:molybdate transport system substrate-binding protein